MYGKNDRRRSFCRWISLKTFIAQSWSPIHSLKERHKGTFSALDMIEFWEFKDLINTQSRISFYLMCQSKQPFKITDRPHHHPRLCHQPMTNLSYRDSATDLLKFHSYSELNGWWDTISSSLFKFSWAVVNEIILHIREFQSIQRSKMSDSKAVSTPWLSK